MSYDPNSQAGQQPPAPTPPPVGYPSAFATPPNPAPPAGPPPVNRAMLAGNEILDGAGVPPELRGRRVSEVFTVYGKLADAYVDSQRRNTQPPPPPPVAPQNNESIYENDEDERLAKIVQRVVSEQVAPFRESTYVAARETAQERARKQVPDFNALEADIIETVRGASAEAMADVNFWINAADLARGRRYRVAELNPAPQPAAEQPNFMSNVSPFTQPTPPAPPAPVAPQPYVTSPRPNPAQFFSESSSAPNLPGAGNAQSLTPMELQIARMAGMTPEQYAGMKNIQVRDRR